MKITKRAIDDLEWNGKQSQIEYDDELKGFGVRVYPSGIKSFVIAGEIEATPSRLPHHEPPAPRWRRSETWRP